MLGDFDALISREMKKDYMISLMKFLSERKKPVYPEKRKWFRALKETPIENIKVVILGQDPYHRKGQADGLAFSSSNSDIFVPLSLRNIFKELHNDLNIPVSTHGDLSKWAREGVLLLNTILTVEDGTPLSHANRGWELFTDKIIKKISDRGNVVFMLWGAKAQTKIKLIDRKKNLILCAAHPSPFSADRGFFGCRHFSKANKYLKGREVNWTLL